MSQDDSSYNEGGNEPVSKLVMTKKSKSKRRMELLIMKIFRGKLE